MKRVSMKNGTRRARPSTSSGRAADRTNTELHAPARAEPVEARAGDRGVTYGAKNPGPHLLLVDNYDSFTFNLVQLLGELGARVEVHRNDEIDVETIRQKRPDALVLSPGPCTPNEAGVTLQAITALAGELPILGVCLGHQSIGQAFGGKVIRNVRIVHGKSSPVHHAGKGLYAGLALPFEAGRYHSLVVEKATLPDCLQVTSWTAEGEIMGLRHATLDVEGVQFHPESILTPQGKVLLGNFLARLRPAAARAGAREATP